MERNMVKIFRSFYDAAKMLPDKETQADYLMAILEYGFDGVLPDTGGIAGAMFLLAKPNIDFSIKKSEAGQLGGQATQKQTASVTQAECKQTPSTTEANAKQTASKPQPEIGSRKKEVGSRSIPPLPPQGFDEFWSSYPKKVGKQSALKSFAKAIKTVDLQTLLTAIDRQKRSSQWSRDNGQYIPNPATWLNQGRWEDELTAEPGNIPDYDSMEDLP